MTMAREDSELKVVKAGWAISKHIQGNVLRSANESKRPGHQDWSIR
jgi:hypothetical protein